MGQADDLTTRVRRTCAEALDRAARTVEPELETDFGYDPEMPPSIPPGETVEEWRRERSGAGPSSSPRGRLARLLRRAAHRLDGSVIDRTSLRY
ncbi:MAG TPA: hypothetical protein VE997_03705 [Candidatus Limnocylindria bacterium]|jgi:hypothetical protein|nr:hypothetical protein [Candidatus Limnocylindria bacterium]